MINFSEFIDKDIRAKKTLITTSPVKTKTNIKKFNANLDSMKAKYEEYKNSVFNYLVAKSNSFNIENNKDIESLTEEVVNLERIKFLLNPSNTYFEKMSFDVLLYKLRNSYMFNFKSLNEVINSFLDKFELVGIRLKSDNFNYTCYVHEYMSSFLEVRYNHKKKYTKVNEIFEQIYWVNPELIEHIELNFRRLIRENKKKFNDYIIQIQKEEMQANNIKNYVDCLEKLKSAHIELNIATKEDISSIIDLAKANSFDINHYLESNKVRTAAYDSLLINVDYSDRESMNKVCDALDRLRSNIEEFNTYNDFLPLFNQFRDDYKELIDVNVKEYKGLVNVDVEIVTKEKELDRLNRRVFGTFGIFDFSSEKNLKKLKSDSVKLAKELYELYTKRDQEYFKTQVLEVVSSSMTISDIMHLYYSFDYFKKLAIQKVYELDKYDEIIKMSDEFYLFASDPTNVIITGIPVFEESDVAKVIANKYRLNNLKISEDDVKPENLKALLNKILLILRVEMINESDKIDLDKIWFMVQVEKICNKNSK